MFRRALVPRAVPFSTTLLLAFLALSVPPGQAQAQSFAMPVELEVPDSFNTRVFATGDFNNDSIPDLATSYGVYLGTPTGFVTPPRLMFFGGEGALLTADMDHDGNLDLVTEYGVAFGDGTGSFSRFNSFGLGATALAVADFDRDGWPDVAVSDANGCLRIVRADGSGGLAVGDCLGPQLQRPVAVGDFNGDGWLDLAASDQPLMQISVYLADGAGGFGAATAVAIGGLPLGVVAGDFDGDGLLDLATTTGNVVTGTLFLLRGRGDGQFDTASDYSCGVSASLLAVGDFNQDGIADLVVANPDDFDQSVSVFTGTRGGPLRGPTRYHTAGNILGLAVTDMGGDGIADLVVAREAPLIPPEGLPLWVLRGHNDGTFDGIVYSPQDLGVVGVIPAVARLDGNGSDDLIECTDSTDLAVLLAKAPGAYEVSEYLPAKGRLSRCAVTGDFDGDGIVDAAVINSAARDLQSFRGRGDGSFDLVGSVFLGDDPVAIAAGDFNGDGITDVVVTLWVFYTGRVQILIGTGSGSFVLGSGYALDLSPLALAVADFDGDGSLDVLIAVFVGSVGTELTLFRGTGDGSLSAGGSVILGTESVTDMAAADFNGDSAVDVAVGIEDGVLVLRGNGEGDFLAPQHYAAGFYPRGLAVADFDGDGLIDLATGVYLFPPDAAPRKHVWVFPGTRAGTFGAPTKLDAVAKGFVAVADANGDGRPDLICVPDVPPFGIFTYLNSTPGNRADLAVSVDDGRFSATASYPQIHAVTVTNHGPGSVDAVQLLLHLPPSLLNPALTPDSGELDANGLWTGLNLASGDSVTLHVTSTLDAAASGRLVVAAQVLPAAGSVDFVPINNVAVDRELILPEPSLSLASRSVPEGDSGVSNAAFTVSLSRASEEPISVHYATADGTAMAGSDYVAASGVLDFAPGVTEQALNVQILGDVVDEDDETFRLVLSAPQNATLADPAGTLETIVDDDAAPEISIDSQRALEGDSGTTPVSFHLTLSRPSVHTVTVSYVTSDGSARGHLDYVPAHGALIFEPGVTTRTLSVGVIGDKLKEPNEDFWIRLSSPRSAVLGNDRGRCVIVDDDRRPPPVRTRANGP
jgi:hypothetical protein